MVSSRLIPLTREMSACRRPGGLEKSIKEGLVFDLESSSSSSFLITFPRLLKTSSSPAHLTNLPTLCQVASLTCTKSHHTYSHIPTRTHTHTHTHTQTCSHTQAPVSPTTQIHAH